MASKLERSVDVLVVSLGSTGGWRLSDRLLVESLWDAGLDTELVVAQAPRQVRTFAATDFVWALAARRAAKQAIAKFSPRKIIYSSVGSALLWPRPGIIRLDAPMMINRPGRHGFWQRPRERWLFRHCEFLLPMAESATAPLPEPRPQQVVLPVPVELGPEPPADELRDVAAVAYTPDPHKKGLDRILQSWRLARRGSEELWVCGAPKGAIPADAEGVVDVGRLEHAEFLRLLRRARVMICAPRREDYGIVQLEALAAGCRVVTSGAEGAYVAGQWIKELAPSQFVADGDNVSDLARATTAALDGHPDAQKQASEARSRIAQECSVEAVNRIVREQIVPKLSA